MNTQEFVQEVLRRLPNISDPLDVDVVAAVIKALHDEGWTVEEAVRYCNCLEEVSPNQDENLALSKMDNIVSQVRERQKKTLN